ncbi:hypothetical protein TNCV_4396371 [Trichonephila clavipes]|uniref:Uncharacterized protein n=1 Tax=Trichonephila clavipes TaxID=2585209 RepID=A0A8X6W5F9_TRICX|nr:hypothetical protein TNCV_4396371 [Trichonephila clavipes]
MAKHSHQKKQTPCVQMVTLKPISYLKNCQLHSTKDRVLPPGHTAHTPDEGQRFASRPLVITLMQDRDLPPGRWTYL